MPADSTIRAVIVEGNSRIPAATILRQIAAAANSPFSADVSQADLKKLYGLGVFEDVQVRSLDVGDGQVDLVYRVREHPFISDFSIEGIDSKLGEQIRAHLRELKLELQPATPFRPALANRAAISTRDFLRSRKYPNADVQVSSERRGESIRIAFRVHQGKKLEIGSVKFAGNHSLSQGELLRQMQFARPARFWARWGGAARYIPEELRSDMERIRVYYKSRGFAAVRVGDPTILAKSRDTKQRIEIEIPIVEGPRYQLVSVKVEGRFKTGAADVHRIIGELHTPSEYNWSLLEASRQKIVDALGHYGYGLARAELSEFPNEAQRTIGVVYKVNAGDPIALGRIEFKGNTRVPDKFLRRELKAYEGALFDTAKLDKSVERLNKSNLLEEVRREDVKLKLNEATNMLDVTINVKEKARQGIYATGGTGGINGGYLGLLYTAFNFLRLGETMSLELDGGASQSNMLLNIVGTHFLGSPFTVALSVFNKYAGFNVANVIPGPESVVKSLRKRSKGIGLSGAYPVTGNLQVGMGFETQRESVDGVTNPTKSTRTELAPFVLFDKTRGSGPETRGYRLSYSQAWDGSLFLKSLDSSRRSIQFTHYANDPWTKGRNSFAFHLHGSWARPSTNSPLFLERRFYPGDESVRGFKRGSLSPWATVPGIAGLQPAGADTVLGFSTEYRIPIRGALSGAGFFDLGWTHLDPKHADELGAGARLIDITNGVLRASIGGELRLQLPMIRQPARMIFSWNPLRLNTVLRNPSSVLRLAEPKTSLRFALGTLY